MLSSIRESPPFPLLGIEGKVVVASIIWEIEVCWAGISVLPRLALLLVHPCSWSVALLGWWLWAWGSSSPQPWKTIGDLALLFLSSSPTGQLLWPPTSISGKCLEEKLEAFWGKVPSRGLYLPSTIEVEFTMSFKELYSLLCSTTIQQICYGENQPCICVSSFLFVTSSL